MQMCMNHWNALRDLKFYGATFCCKCRDTAEWKELNLIDVVVTKEGTVEGRPLMDFRLTDADGNDHYFMVTGRIVKMIAAFGGSDE
jgi:hypothetical protein